MRYFETREQSAEILRLILAAMSQHDAAYHPVSYAVWYEYLGELNDSLKVALDERLASNARLTDAMVQELYERHIVAREDDKLDRLQGTLEQLLQELARDASAVATQAGEYGASLQRRASQLRAAADEPETLRTLIGALLEETEQLQGSTGRFSVHALARAAEVHTLRSELQEARREALTDPLTGLKNRRAFDLVAQGMLDEAAREQRTLSLVLLDIDHFKRINDAYGHLFGDRVLRAVAGVLSGGIKGRDVATRFGGEEFAVLLPSTDLAGACAVGEQLRAAVERGLIRRGGTQESIGSITVSLGVAEVAPGENLDKLVERADRALYEAKRAGRNSVRTAPAP